MVVLPTIPRQDLFLGTATSFLVISLPERDILVPELLALQNTRKQSTAGLRVVHAEAVLQHTLSQEKIIVNASARPPRLAGLPTVGTCNYRYTGI